MVRLRILKLPLYFRHKTDVDNVWFTCCILHNLLYEFDWLGNIEADVPWSGEDGLHDAWIADPETDVSTVGVRTESIGEEKTERESKHDLLRKALIESFVYRVKTDVIVWLSRSKKCQFLGSVHVELSTSVGMMVVATRCSGILKADVILSF